MYSGMEKGTSWAEAMLNSKKIKPINQVVSLSVEKIPLNF